MFGSIFSFSAGYKTMVDLGSRTLRSVTVGRCPVIRVDTMSPLNEGNQSRGHQPIRERALACHLPLTPPGSGRGGLWEAVPSDPDRGRGEPR